MTTPPDVTVRPDGSVLIPPDVAREILRPIVRDLAARVRADGVPLSPRTVAFLVALHNADAHPASSAPGTTLAAPVTVEMTARQAAALLACSSEFVRRLARSGRLKGHKAGPVWLIDSASLDAYRHGEPHDRSTRTRAGAP